MRNETRGLTRGISIGLHALGVAGALCQLVGAMMAAVASVAVAGAAPVLAAAGGVAVVAVVVGLLGACVSVLVCSGLALIVEHTARTAAATEELADSLRRLDLEKTTDSGLFYRIR